MLKMRRVWRRTSSSQAEPSPWRHCWTSWASCSNVSSASKPATVTSLPQKLHGANFGLQLWNANCSRKVPCSSGPGDRPRVGASYSGLARDTSLAFLRRESPPHWRFVAAETAFQVVEITEKYG